MPSTEKKQMTLEEIDAELASLDAEIEAKTRPTAASTGKPMTLEEIDAELAQLDKEIAASPGHIGALEAGGRAAFQTATLGFGEEIIAGARSLFGDKTYEQTLAEERQKLERARAEQPRATIAGTVGGALATAPLAPLKGAGLAASIVRPAVGGAVAGLGEAEDKLSVEGLKAAGEGALLGGAFGSLFKGLEVASKPTLSALEKVGIKLGRKAGEKAGKAAIGNQAKVMKILASKDQAQKRAMMTEAIREGADPDELKKLMDLFTDNKELVRLGQKALKDKTVTFGTTAEKINARTVIDRTKAGDAFGNILDEVDAAVGEAFIDGAQIGTKFRRMAENIKGFSKNRSSKLAVIKDAEEFERMGKLTLGQLQEIKNADFRFTPGDVTARANKQTMNSMERAIAKTIEEGVEARGGKELLAKFKDIKKNFGDAATLSEASRTLADRQAKNQAFGLTDKILLAGGVASGDAVKGILLSGANKILRDRGNAMAAVSLNALSKFLKKAPPGFAESATGKALANAMRNGSAALATTHLQLIDSDPGYLEMLTKHLGLGASIKE